MTEKPRYSERQALDEAEQMRQMTGTGVAETYTDAERAVQQENERNLRLNIDRHREAIGPYLEHGYLENLPKEFQPQYQQMLERHDQELQRSAIDPRCTFTLVLPAFREERVIQQALESLQRQRGVDQATFEVIVVVNYEAGRPPRNTDYDRDGQPIGSHLDQTRQIAERVAASSDVKIHVIEQEFPSSVKGVAIASKLGMDLALKRQAEQPGIIGYYGADTIFDPHWVEGVLDGYARPDTDGVRGVARSAPVDRRVEDERGLHILSESERDEIVELNNQQWEYSQRLYKLEDIFHRRVTGSARQISGLPTMTAGMYALIGGMKAFRHNREQKKELMVAGEDWNIAQEVADRGSIYWNERMQTQALGRIERPRAGDDSYTGSLWTMYRAYMYGEGDQLDKERHLLVDDPERALAKHRFSHQLLELFVQPDRMDVPPQLTALITPDELPIIRSLMKAHDGDWNGFLASVPPELGATIIKRLNDTFPKIPIDVANEKFKDVAQAI